MTLTRTFLAATAAIALSAGTASALGVSISGSATSFTGQNDFDQSGEILDGLDLVQGPGINIDLIGASSAFFTFTEVGAESGFDNDFLFDGTTRLSESVQFGAGLNSVTADEPSFTETVLASQDIEDRLSFFVNDTTTTIGPGHTGFGVFFDSANNGSLTTFFLALDDQNSPGEDDNHDDYVIRVDVAAVPLPAAAWLLLGVSGGLIAAKRRSSARKAA